MGLGGASRAHDQRCLLAELLGWGPDLVESSVLVAVGVFQLRCPSCCHGGARLDAEIRAPPVWLQGQKHVLGTSPYLHVLITMAGKAWGSALPFVTETCL